MHNTSRCSKPISPISHWPGQSWAVQVCGCTVLTESIKSTHLVAWQLGQVFHTHCGRSTLLSGPATSVPSEHLFSSAGDIADDKRTCLLAENLDCLVFLKANLMWNCVNVNVESRWWTMDGIDNDDELQLWRWVITKSLQSTKQLFVFSWIIVSIIRIRPNSKNPYSVQP